DEMLDAVERVLGEIGAGELPVELVLNKIDAIDPLTKRRLANRFPDALLVSARTGEGLDELRRRVADRFADRFEPVRLLIPYADGARLAELYALGAPVDERADRPERAYAGDAGLDLAACERHELAPGERALVGTGLAVAIPEGYAGFVQPRSGLAARHGLSVVNAPGLIDAGYRGEISVVLLNTDLREPFVVDPGMRIAQLVVLPVPELELAEVEE